MCIWKKVLAVVITLIAIALAVTVSIWHAEALNYIIFISRFFDVMLPILAVGALVKYLFTCACGCGCCQQSKKDQQP